MSFWWWVAPIVLFALFSPFSSDLDLATSRFFYDSANQTFSTNGLFQFMYLYGILPALFLGGFSALVYLFSLLRPQWKRYKHPALMLALTLTLGCGLITNEILKEYWGRPRPQQTVEFGGDQQFRPFYIPNFNPPMALRSFPCGHCTMGFFFFSLVVLGWRFQNKNLLYIGVILSVVLGVLLSISRIAQGGHYLSDTLASALVLWLCTLTIDYTIFEGLKRKNERNY